MFIPEVPSIVELVKYNVEEIYPKTLNWYESRNIACWTQTLQIHPSSIATTSRLRALQRRLSFSGSAQYDPEGEFDRQSLSDKREEEE